MQTQVNEGYKVLGKKQTENKSLYKVYDTYFGCLGYQAKILGSYISLLRCYILALSNKRHKKKTVRFQEANLEKFLTMVS